MTTAIETNVPVLRFPQFSGEWKKKKMKEVIAGISSGTSVNSIDEPISSENQKGILKTSCISSGKFYPKFNKSIVMEEVSRVTLSVKKETILISRMNTPQLVGESGYVDRDYPNLFIPDRIWLTEVDKNNDTKFISILLASKNMMDKISNIATGTSGSMKNIAQPNFLNLQCIIPFLSEQQRIASFLTAIDAKIELLSTKKALLEQYKKGVMQQLFSQQIRFKDDEGNEFPEWEEKQLSEILTEHKTRNTGTKYKEVLSVAKEKGVINQIEHLGRSYASEDISNYKVVFSSDIVYTKSPTSDFPFGIIKQNKTGRIGVVSVLYGVFKPVNLYLGSLLDYYFSSGINTYNYLNPLVEKGAKNTMNIGNNTFLNGSELSLPTSIEEQKKIVSFISGIDKKISEAYSQIELVKTYKKGLLQQLFV